MKKIIIKIISILSGWVHRNHKLYIALKDLGFTQPDEHLIRTVRFISKNKLYQPGQTIIDIGAANGSSANFFSIHYSNCKVIAFEPIKEMYDLCKRTYNNNNVTFINKGLSTKAGKENFLVSENNYSSSLLKTDAEELNKESKEQINRIKLKRTEEVDIAILDDEIKATEILLIKIDVQGAEVMALSGGLNTLKKTKLVLIEMNNHKIYKDGCMYFDADAFLREQNFKLVDIIVSYRDDNYIVKEYDALYYKS